MSRKRRRRKVGKHISLSATDADWETVRSNANRRGLSIARYLVELVERDASEEDEVSGTSVLRWRSLRKSSGSCWRRCGRFAR